jgi:hypothetical protein
MVKQNTSSTDTSVKSSLSISPNKQVEPPLSISPRRPIHPNLKREIYGEEPDSPVSEDKSSTPSYSPTSNVESEGDSPGQLMFAPPGDEPDIVEVNADNLSDEDNPDESIDELKRICSEMYQELKGHVTDVPVPLLVASIIFAGVGLTSWGCNYNDAVPQLVQHFKDAFNINIDSSLAKGLVEALRVSAGTGGAGGNAVLNYYGTRNLKSRWETIKKSYKDKSYGYLLSYIAVGGSAILAAISNGAVVAESASNVYWKIGDFLLNFSSSVGPHMLFSIPFVGILLRSPLGDTPSYFAKYLRKIKEHFFTCDDNEQEKSIFEEDELDDDDDESNRQEYSSLINANHDGHNKKKKVDHYLYSAVFNINRRLIVRTGYALASLADNNEKGISKLRQQIEIIVNVLDTLSTATMEEGADNPFASYPKVDLLNLTSKGEIRYLLALSSFLSKLSLDKLALVFLRIAKALNVQPESELEGIMLTMANTVSLPVSALSCLANITSINKACGKIASLFTSNATAINTVGLTGAALGAPSKDAMYWNSLLTVIERAFLLPQTIKWLWQSSKLVKALIPAAGMTALITGVCSGACYALDALNLIGSVLGGYLIDFFNLFGAQGVLIGTVTFVLLSWILGAGTVNGNALSTVASDIVLSVIHIIQPEQKANDAVCKQAIALSLKMIGNMVPDSKEGLALEKVITEEYDATLEQQERQRLHEPRESCGQWALRLATFGFYKAQEQPVTYNNDDASSMVNFTGSVSEMPSF